MAGLCCRRRRWAVPSSLPALLLALVLTLPPALRAVIDRENPPRSAVQTPYRAGTPHTDRVGTPRTAYQAGVSFLPIGLYHGLMGRRFGRGDDPAALRAAGFNTVHVWEGMPLEEIGDAAGESGLSLIVHLSGTAPDADAVRALAGRPGLLAWYLDEEPSLHLPPEAQPAALAVFETRARAIRQLDPVHPVLAVDYPAFLGIRRTGWLNWAGAGDISVHDNYPVGVGRLETLDTATGIPRSVALAVAVTGGRKPVWLVVQAMASPTHGWRMPKPEELRAMVYAGLIHGATGILYFALDSFVTREGRVVGIAPDPPADYGPTPGFGDSAVPALTADEDERAASRRLWHAVAALNRELAVLTPSLLSPTSAMACIGVPAGPGVSPVPIRTLLKDDPHGPVLLAVNLDRRPLDVDIRCDRPVKTVTRLFEHAPAPAPLAVSGWHDTFAPLAVHLYRLATDP